MKRLLIFLLIALSLSANAQISKAKLFFYLVSQGSGGVSPSIPQATDIVFSNVLDDQFTISWTSTADYNLVAIREDEAVNDVPIDGVVYDPDSELGAGDEVGAYNWVVYDGAGTSVTVTGLTANKTYHVQVFAHTGTTEPNTVYNISTASGNPSSQLTDPEPVINLPFITVNENSFNAPNSERIFTNGSQRSLYIDATNYDSVRLEVYVATQNTSANSPIVYPAYSLNDGSTWTGFGSASGSSISSQGRKLTDWVVIPDAARVPARYFFVENGGDGSSDPTISRAFLHFK